MPLTETAQWVEDAKGATSLRSYTQPDGTVNVYESDGTTYLGKLGPTRFLAGFGTTIGAAVNNTTTTKIGVHTAAAITSWLITFDAVLDGDMNIELLLNGTSFPTPIVTLVTAATGSNYLQFNVTPANWQTIASGSVLTAELTGLTATNALDVDVSMMLQEL